MQSTHQPQYIYSRLQECQGLLWDFDGVVYSYHDPNPMQIIREIFFRANVNGAMSAIPGLCEEEAYKLAVQAFETHHDTVSGYLHFSESQGISRDELRQRILHHQFVDMFETVLPLIPETFKACQAMKNHLNTLSAQIEHVVVTHGHAQHWSRKIAKHMSIEPFFKDMLGYEELGFANKGKSADYLIKGFEALGCNSSQTVFIEDDPKHLKIAKQAYPELLTVWVHDHQGQGELPGHIDIAVPRVRDFLGCLVEAKGINEKEKYAG